MRAVIAQGHRLFRDIVAGICTREPRFSDVVAVDHGAAALRACGERDCRLLVLDRDLCDMDGFEVAAQAQVLAPEARILMAASDCDEYTVVRTQRCRIAGFIDANVLSFEAVRDAITRVAAGEAWFSPTFHRIAAERHRDPHSFHKLLSDRELMVLSLIALPCNDLEIGRQLGISAQTVEKHRFNIIRKLGMVSTIELARFARIRGIVFRARLASAS